MPSVPLANGNVVVRGSTHGDHHRARELHLSGVGRLDAKVTVRSGVHLGRVQRRAEGHETFGVAQRIPVEVDVGLLRTAGEAL